MASSSPQWRRLPHPDRRHLTDSGRTSLRMTLNPHEVGESLAGTAVLWRLTPILGRNYKISFVGRAKHPLTKRRTRRYRSSGRGPYALHVMTHSGTFITIGPLTAAEAARWETNLAASAGYLIGLAIGGTVRRIPCGPGEHDIDPAAVPDHTESISIGLLTAWAAPGVDPIERLRIALCGRHGPERAYQLMSTVPNSHEARQISRQGRLDLT